MASRDPGSNYGHTGHRRLGKDGLVIQINQTQLQLDLARGPAKTKDDYNEHGLYGSFYERRNRLREGRGRIKTLGNYPGRKGRGWGGNSKNKHSDRTNRVFSFGASDAVDRHFDAKLLEFEAKLMAEETQVEAYENAVLPLHHQADSENIELQADEIHLKCDDFYASNTDGKSGEHEMQLSPEEIRKNVQISGRDPFDPANYPPHEAQLRIGASVKVVGTAPDGAVSSTNRIDGSYTLNVGGRLTRSCGEHNVEYKSGYELRVGGKKSELKAKKSDEFVHGHRSLINHAAYVNTNLLFSEAYVGPDTRVVGVNTLGLALVRMWGNLVPGVRTYGGLARLDKHLMPKYKVFEQKGGTRISEVQSENRIAGTHLRAWYIFGARNKKPWWIKRIVKKEPQVMQKKLDALMSSAGGLASAGGSSKAPVAITALANAAGLGDDAAAAATQSATVLNKAVTVVAKGSPIYETVDDALTAGQQAGKVATKVINTAVTTGDLFDDSIYSSVQGGAKAGLLLKQGITKAVTAGVTTGDLFDDSIYSSVQGGAKAGVVLKQGLTKAVTAGVTAGEIVDDYATAADALEDALNAGLVLKKGLTKLTGAVTAGDLLDDAGNSIYSPLSTTLKAGLVPLQKASKFGLLANSQVVTKQLVPFAGKSISVVDGLDELANVGGSGLSSSLQNLAPSTFALNTGLGGTGGVTGGLGGGGSVAFSGTTAVTDFVFHSGGVIDDLAALYANVGVSGGSGASGGIFSGLGSSGGLSGFSFVPWSPPTGGLPRASALLVNPPSFLDPSTFWTSFVQSNFPDSFRNFI